jgi:hypothetical protein
MTSFDDRAESIDRVTASGIFPHFLLDESDVIALAEDWSFLHGGLVLLLLRKRSMIEACFCMESAFSVQLLPFLDAFDPSQLPLAASKKYK